MRVCRVKGTPQEVGIFDEWKKENNFGFFSAAISGLDFSNIHVPGGSSSGVLQNPISVGAEDDPAVIA